MRNSKLPNLLAKAGPPAKAAILAIAVLLMLFIPSRAAADDDDPPSRVARLSFLRGSVSFNPAGTDDWVDAVLNRPVTTGDKLWADKGSRAELHLGSASIRTDENTGFSFLNLDDRTTQLQLTDGTLRIRIKRLGENEVFEVDTPNLAFSLLRPGIYKINVNESGDTTVVQVVDGQGEVTGGGSAYNVRAGESGTFTGTDQLSADVENYGGDNDDFDRWCYDRDKREDHSSSARYVSDDVVGYEDLDDYGGWRPVSEYGQVWFPHVTVVGWAPYRYGHWVWISPWGWTWVEDEPWGFAPFHYGRWVVVGGVWGWVPGPRPVVGVAYVRPVYSPALVAWVGGPHFAVGVGVGAGVAVGWFPLGPREVYVPSYHVSRTYVTNVNVTNTVVNTTVVNNYYNNVVVNKNVNVTNVTYVNRTAVTAVNGQAFTSAQPVARNMVKVDAREVASAPVVATTPGVAPQQRSVLGAGAQARVQPPAAVASRAVVAKTPPPPPAASFAQQRQQIEANGGRPVPASQIRVAGPREANASAEARSNVRVAPAAQPVNVQPGQRITPQNRPAQNQQNAAVNPNRPPNAQNPANTPPNANRPNQPANQPNAVNPNNAHNYSDRPPSARPTNPTNSNPQLDQKHQQQLDQLRQKQDQERQQVEQQQQRQQQQLAKQRADEARQQQVQQRQQQQLEQLEQKHDQQQQKLQQKQQQERSRSENRPPPKESKPKEKPPEKPH